MPVRISIISIPPPEAYCAEYPRVCRYNLCAKYYCRIRANSVTTRVPKSFSPPTFLDKRRFIGYNIYNTHTHVRVYKYRETNTKLLQRFQMSLISNVICVLSPLPLSDLKIHRVALHSICGFRLEWSNRILRNPRQYI